MKDGSDAIADWAILNALINTCAGATWVSVHHGGGVGMVTPCTRAWSSWQMGATRLPNGSSAF